MKVDLDEALRGYVDVTVPLGMEARILARCARRPWKWPVLGLAACLGCLAFVWPEKKSVEPAPAQLVKFVNSVQKPVVGAKAPFHRKRRKPNGVYTLWRFAQEHPEEAVQLTAVYDSKPIEPLQIEPILIEELEIDQR